MYRRLAHSIHVMHHLSMVQRPHTSRVKSPHLLALPALDPLSSPFHALYRHQFPSASSSVRREAEAMGPLPQWNTSRSTMAPLIAAYDLRKGTQRARGERGGGLGADVGLCVCVCAVGLEELETIKESQVQPPHRHTLCPSITSPPRNRCPSLLSLSVVF